MKKIHQDAFHYYMFFFLIITLEKKFIHIHTTIIVSFL